jgi:hypothetical protein
LVSSLRAGRDEAAAGLAGVEFDSPKQVAQVILELVRTGDAQADLVPVAYGGSRR